jgi:hypothetical protein
LWTTSLHGVFPVTSSWNIPRTAAPRLGDSHIISMTMARFAMSIAAVGPALSVLDIA